MEEIYLEQLDRWNVYNGGEFSYAVVYNSLRNGNYRYYGGNDYDEALRIYNRLLDNDIPFNMYGQGLFLLLEDDGCSKFGEEIIEWFFSEQYGKECCKDNSQR